MGLLIVTGNHDRVRGVGAAALLGVLAVPASATRLEVVDSFVPPRPVGAFRAEVREGNRVELVGFRLPESWAQRRLFGAAFVGDVVEHGGTTTYGGQGESSGIIERRTFPARPDASSFSERLAVPAEYVLAQARAGTRALFPAREGGRSAWRTTVALHANECAGLRAGTAELWLDRATLLPLRVVERRGRQVFPTRIVYRSLGSAGKERFLPPLVGRRPVRQDRRFRRVSALAAGAALPYTPRLPTTFPTGFTLAVTGWAPRSARTGPEASNPVYRALFAAVYRRGLERIDVTQRVAAGRGWLSDPFGAECAFVRSERAAVNGVPATYGIGETIVPHLYWRNGNLLLTVSGPFPKADLVRIAESLSPVTG